MRSLALLVVLFRIVSAHHTGNNESICWESAKYWQHCNQEAVHIEWKDGEPPHKVPVHEVNLMQFNLTVNTTLFPICHSEAIVPSINICETTDGFCTPFTLTPDVHNSTICRVEFLDDHWGCDVHEPLDIDGYFPLYLTHESAAAVSPSNETETRLFGGLRLFMPTGVPTWEGTFDAGQLSVFESVVGPMEETVVEVSCHSVFCTDVIHSHHGVSMDEFDLHGVEFSPLDPAEPELVTATFTETFVLDESDISFTVLVHVDLVTCNGMSMVVSLGEFGVVPLPEPNVLIVTDTMHYLVDAIAGLGLLTLVVLSLLLFLYRNHRVIVASQRELLFLILGFGFVALVGLIFHDVSSDFSCTTRLWNHDFALACIFSLLIIRVWRVDRYAQAAKKCQRANISNTRVLLVAFALVLPLVALNGVRTYFHPSTAHLDAFENGIDYEWRCTGEHSIIYDMGTAAYAMCLLALGAHAAYRSSLLVDRYNEGKTMGLAIHNGVVLTLITIPPSVKSHGDPDVNYFLLAVSTTLIVCVLSCSLLIPRFRFIWQEGKVKLGEYEVTDVVAAVAQLLGGALPEFTEEQIVTRFDVQHYSHLTKELHELLAAEMTTYQQLAKSVATTIPQASLTRRQKVPIQPSTVEVSPTINSIAKVVRNQLPQFCNQGIVTHNQLVHLHESVINLQNILALERGESLRKKSGSHSSLWDTPEVKENRRRTTDSNRINKTPESEPSTPMSGGRRTSPLSRDRGTSPLSSRFAGSPAPTRRSRAGSADHGAVVIMPDAPVLQRSQSDGPQIDDNLV